MVSALIMVGATIAMADAQTPEGIKGLISGYSNLPQNVLENTLSKGLTDEDGMGSINKRGWRDVGVQRGQGRTLMLAVVKNDKSAADRALDDIDKTVSMMNPDGSWEANRANGSRASRSAAVSGNAFYLADTVPGLMAVSTWGGKYEDRASDLKAKLKPAARFTYEERDRLYGADERQVNRITVDAVAFTVLGAWYGNSDYKRAGRDFTKFAIDSQLPNGVIPEDGGGDSSYQGVSLRSLAIVYYFDPSPSVKSALVKGTEWWLKRFDSQGKIDARGNARTGLNKVGKHTVAAGQSVKAGHNPNRMAEILALLADLLPESGARQTLDKFVRLAFNGDRAAPVSRFVISD